MRPWSAMLLVLALTTVAGDAMAQRRPLGLGDILDNVARTHPKMDAARAKMSASEGKALSARGAFDTYASAKGKYVPVGTYARRELGVELRQPTTWWGLEVMAGWRYGVGKFPPYYLENETEVAGEVFAGLTLPIWRDGPIDARRVEIAQTRLQVEIADQALTRAQLDLELDAAKAYWDWVAAGLKLELERELLKLATTRQSGIESQVKRGEKPKIDGIENRRAILERRGRLIEAQQDLDVKGLKLGLYWRDNQGRQLKPDASRLPNAIAPLEPPKASTLERDVKQARRQRPEMRQLDVERRKASLDRDLAENQLGPQLDFSLEVAQDIDPRAASLTDDYHELALGLKFSLPLQRRKAKGKLDTAEADLVRVGAESRWLGDKVETEVRQIATRLQAARQREVLSRQELAISLQVERAERRRFDLGDSSQLLVNLREQKRVSAAKKLIEAQSEVQKAWAELQVAIGRALSR